MSAAEWGCNATLTLVEEDGEQIEEWDDGADTPLMLGEQEWYRCPRRPVKDDPRLFMQLIKYRNIRENGSLPFPGSYMQQPNYLVEALAVIDQALAEVASMRDKRDKARRGETDD